MGGLWLILWYNIFMDIKDLFYKNYSNQEIADALGISLSTVKRRLTKLGLRRTDEQKGMIISRTIQMAINDGRMKFRYGDDNPARRPEVREKLRKTVREKLPIIVEKRRETMLRRYGVENPFQNEEIKQKIKETNLKKYGVENPNQLKSFKQESIKKQKKTLAKKYNHDERITLLKETFQKLGRKLNPKEMIALWGCTQANAYIFMHNNHLEEYIELKTSNLELDIENFLKAHGINFKKHCRNIIAPQELDFYIPEYNVAIEANDLWTHNSTRNTYGGKAKDKKYHFKKSQECEEKGIRLIHIWDYEWFNARQRPILESIILGACNQSEKIFARKCSIEVVDSKTMKDFFNKNNIQGFRGGKMAINLVYNGEVVMSYILGFPFFGRGKYQWEVIRGATKLNCRVIGGATKIWKYFLRNYDPESCVYYIDYNYFNGNSVEKLGLEYLTTKPSFKNYFINERKIRNRQPTKHKEIKQQIEEGKVLEIYNAGVKVYLYKRK